MELALSPEQEEIRRLAHDFAVKEVKPRAQAIDQDREFPQDLVDKASALGLLGILVPEEYGGAGLDHLSFAIVIEEIARFCASTAVIIDVHTSVGTEPIALFGTAEGRAYRGDTPERCTHWWHRDLSDRRVVHDLLNDPNYARTSMRDDDRLKPRLTEYQHDK